jgi:hypothetical protein
MMKIQKRVIRWVCVFLAGSCIGVRASDLSGATVSVHESWCDIECPAEVRFGEPFEIKVTMHGLDEGLLAGCVAKAITKQGKEAGIVGRFKQIKGIENERTYTLTSVIKDGPDWLSSVRCFLTVSSDGSWDRRVHNTKTPPIQVVR